jgi:hypothetical protein
MRFACVRTQARGNSECGFEQREARRRMVIAEKIKQTMSPNELAIRLEKGRIMRHSLIQQVGRP